LTFLTWLDQNPEEVFEESVFVEFKSPKNCNFNWDCMYYYVIL